MGNGETHVHGAYVRLLHHEPSQQSTSSVQDEPSSEQAGVLVACAGGSTGLALVLVLLLVPFGEAPASNAALDARAGDSTADLGVSSAPLATRPPQPAASTTAPIEARTFDSDFFIISSC